MSRSAAVLDRAAPASAGAGDGWDHGGVHEDRDAGALERALEALVAVMGRCEVAELPVARLEVLVSLVRRLDRIRSGLLARVASRARDLAELGVGPGSAALLTGDGQVSAATVRADDARALALRSLPCLGEGLAAGAVGVDHVDLVAGVWARATEAERVELAGVDGELAQAATRLSVESFDRRVHRTVARIRRRVGPQAAAAKEPELRWWWGRDNMGRLSGQLTAEQYERVAVALGAEMTELVHQHRGAAGSAEESPTSGGAPMVALDARLAAEALVSRVTGAGQGRIGRPAITIVVDATTVTTGPHESGVCETSSGGSVPGHVLDRCACDAVVRTVTLDSRGVPIDVGRAQRTATAAQWAALTALYATCAWHGCDRPVDWCQAHHVIYWEHLGPTDLDNLVPLCNHHHHQVHEGGWRLVLHADRRLDHHRPDGEAWRTSHPDRLSG